VQDCGLNDDALAVLGKRIWRMKKVQLTGCNFSYKGLGALTFKMTDQASRFYWSHLLYIKCMFFQIFLLEGHDIVFLLQYTYTVDTPSKECSIMQGEA
jgi:hypothetical protein